MIHLIENKRRVSALPVTDLEGREGDN